MRSTKLILILLLSVNVILAGCNSELDLVKDGTFNAYPNTTIGKAFEATFDEPKWEVGESKKGTKYVDFTGKVSKDFFKVLEGYSKLAPDKCKVGDPVNFQFLVAVDVKSFNLGFIDPKGFPCLYPKGSFYLQSTNQNVNFKSFIIHNVLSGN